VADDERQIRALIAEWIRASAAGEHATVLSLMTDDVVFLVPGHEPFGKAEFAEADRAMAGRFRLDGRSEVEEVVVAGDWAFCRTHLRLAITPADGSPTMRRAGRTLSVFRKQPDGAWKLARAANRLAPEAEKPA